MVQLNPHFHRLKRPYIFPLIEKKLEELESTIPKSSLINLGIGDIALPLAPSVASAISQAVLKMTSPEGLHGYGPTEGYPFLKEAIQKEHPTLSTDEIFVSDGINSDGCNILELFALTSKIAIADPNYPAYFNSTLIRGHKAPLLLPCTEENLFVPLPPHKRCDIIYLCTPSNPTGVALTRKELQLWVEYALTHDALLLVDAAYAAFIQSPDVPKSIFEIPGAELCAIEFHSFSKSAGFTGLRCAYTLLPKTVRAYLKEEKVSLHPFWKKRQAAKFNGVAYPIQKGAEAALSSQGKKETKAQVASYLQQAHRLKTALLTQGMTCYGGTDCPYIWIKTPKSRSSWDFFEELIRKFHILSIPGCGFGPSGEGFVRLSCFATEEKITLALNRLCQ